MTLIRRTLQDVILGILPISVLVSLLHFFVVEVPGSVYADFLGGTLLVGLGLLLFLLGVNVGLLKAGGAIGSALSSNGKLWVILLFGFIVGFAVTVPEPDVQVLALQVGAVSQGSIDQNSLVMLIALGVGVFTALALLRVFLGLSTYYILVGGYGLAFILLPFYPPEYASIAFDAGGVTTGSLTVPFVLSLGVGVYAVAARKSRYSNSFGILALASLGPVLTVLIFGVLSMWL